MISRDNIGKNRYDTEKFMIKPKKLLTHEAQLPGWTYTMFLLFGSTIGDTLPSYRIIFFCT